MNTCKTCKHWERYGEDNYRLMPGAGHCKAVPRGWSATDWDPDYNQRVILPEFAHCKAFVQDGSDYWAQLQTLPDFGCVMHEDKE